MKSEHEWRRSFARSALSMLLLAAACGKSSLAPSEVLSQSTTTAHFDFRFASGDAVDAPRQEAFHDWIVARLGVSGTQRMTFNKYRDRNHIEKATGMSTNGFADPSTATVHSIWTWDAHEAVHVYTAAIGRPSDFFNEGIAVALSTDPLAGRFVSLWNNTPIHQIAADTLRAGLIPPLSTMVETEAFRRVSDQASYPLAGSFVSYLIDTHGMAAMREFFQGSRTDPLVLIRLRFTLVFGLTLEDAELAWRAYLSAR
jgi:hypothetical protein